MQVSMKMRCATNSVLVAALCTLAACSGGSGGSSDTGAGTAPTRQPGISLAAGAAWSYFGAADGGLEVAKFNVPAGMAVDRSGTIYVVDAYNYTIRKISAGGQVSILAGKAGVQAAVDGSGAQAQFSNIFNIVVDASGNLYTTDAGRLRKITPSGLVSTLALTANLTSPAGMAIDAASNIYVADTLDYTIRKITPAGVVSTLAGQSGAAGSIDGAGSGARFTRPRGLAFDAAGNLLVADQHTVRKVTPGGIVTTVAGDAAYGGVQDGQGGAARFDAADSVAIGADGMLYVTDRLPNSTSSVVRKVSASGLVVTLAPAQGFGGNVDYLAVDGNGDLLLSGSSTSTIWKISGNGQSAAYAGGVRVEAPSRDGAALAAHFNGIRGVTADAAGNYYVSDAGNCSVRKVAPSAQVTTLAGSAGACSRVDGSGSAARFKLLGDLSSDLSGNLYVIDGATVRKIGLDGTVSTLAGSGDSASVKMDGVGAAAAFVRLKSISADTKGNLFVSDGATYCAAREGLANPAQVPSSLRTVSPAGAVATLPYASGYDTGLRDGASTTATVGCVSAVKNDSLDNLYFADGQRGAGLSVRKRTADGVLTTLTPTAISLPVPGNQGVYLAPDGLGNVYIGESAGNESALYRIDSNGVKSRIVGSQAAPGDTLTLPAGVMLDSISGLHYLGNKQLLVVTEQSVLKIDLP